MDSSAYDLGRSSNLAREHGLVYNLSSEVVVVLQNRLAEEKRQRKQEKAVFDRKWHQIRRKAHNIGVKF